MNEASLPQRIPPCGHNHNICVSQALETAEKRCRELGLRFTVLRRRVLQLVWDSHRPVGAYDILDSLKQDGKKAAPPTVYRALDFLIDADLVHRLDSLNAFVGCSDPSSSHRGQFLICRGCRTVVELDDAKINSLVQDIAADLGFTAEQQMLEIQGLCQVCREAGV